MTKDQFDPSVRLLGKVVAGLGVFFITIVVARLGLNREPESPLLRGALVALALAGLGTWLWTTMLSIRAQDEFTQRVHLVALSLAFAATGVFVFTADCLQRAGFLGYLPLTTISLAMVVFWWLSLMITARFYR